MNSVNLIGNITRDLEVKEFGSTKVLSFSVAVQKRVKDKNTGEYGANYINCKAFNKTAEIIAQHFSKGSKIGIEGEIDTGRYEDKDGKTVYTTDVVVRNITFVERKGQSNTNTQPQQNNAATPPQNANNSNPFNNAAMPDLNTQDLPF